MDESNSNFDEKKLDNDDFDDEVDDDASRIDGDSKYFTGVDKVSHYEKVADDADKTFYDEKIPVVMPMNFATKTSPIPMVFLRRQICRRK